MKNLFSILTLCSLLSNLNGEETTLKSLIELVKEDPNRTNAVHPLAYHWVGEITQAFGQENRPIRLHKGSIENGKIVLHRNIPNVWVLRPKYIENIPSSDDILKCKTIDKIEELLGPKIENYNYSHCWWERVGWLKSGKLKYLQVIFHRQSDKISISEGILRKVLPEAERERYLTEEDFLKKSKSP